MATIEKHEGKKGVSYRITVYAGFDSQGKRIRHRKTWKPERGDDSPTNGKSSPAGGSGL